MSSWELLSSKEFQVANEYDQLKHVILGTSRGYDRLMGNSATDEQLANSITLTGNEIEYKLELEFASLRSMLEEHGVQVYHPVRVDKCNYHHICPRDIGFIIADTLIISNMKNRDRKLEFEGIRHLIAQWEGRVTLIPESIHLEGGDVLIDGHRIFVASGSDKSPGAVDFIRQNFNQNYDVIPMPCKSMLDGENFPYLDRIFNILGHNYVLIYPQGLNQIPQVLHDEYHWIEITKEEMEAFAANVLSINADTILVNRDPVCDRVNNILSDIGFRTIDLKFAHINSTGASLRSTTLPLIREPTTSH